MLIRIFIGFCLLVIFTMVLIASFALFAAMLEFVLFALFVGAAVYIVYYACNRLGSILWP